MQVACGEIERGRVYEIEYLCTTPGPGEESGVILAYWDGYVHHTGSLKIIPVNGNDEYYLFPSEFVSVEPV